MARLGISKPGGAAMIGSMGASPPNQNLSSLTMGGTGMVSGSPESPLDKSLRETKEAQ